MVYARTLVGASIAVLLAVPSTAAAQTKLQLVLGAGDTVQVKQQYTVETPEDLTFAWSTNAPGAATGLWRVTDGGTVVASGTTPAPAPGRTSYFVLGKSTFLPAVPPKTAKTYLVTVTAQTVAQLPAGAPSAPVEITQVAGDGALPFKPVMSKTATYPSVQITAFDEATPLNYGGADVTVRLSNPLNVPTDPIWFRLDDQNKLMAQKAPAAVGMLNPGFSQVLKVHLDVVLPRARTQFQSRQYEEWNRMYKDACGVDLRASMQWRGPTDVAPLNPYGTSPAPFEGWERFPQVPQSGRICKLVESIRSKWNVPALGAAVVSAKDGVTSIGVSGIRKDGAAVKVTDRDLWHLGSDTKAMTATLVAVLIDKGTPGLSWNTMLGQVFPSGPGFTINDYFKNVTLDQLMTHRAGLPGSYSPAADAVLKNTSLPVKERRAQSTRLLISQPPRMNPSTYLYSNADFVVVGAVLERLTGKSWEDLMRTELFGPLGMTHWGFGPPGYLALDQPWGHRDTPQGRQSFHDDNPEAMGPAGTVNASLYDWAKFVRLHMNRSEGALTLSKPSFDHMHTPLKPAPSEGLNYVSGWITFPWGSGTGLGHDGSNTKWYCRVSIDLARGLAVLVVSNMGGDLKDSPQPGDDAVNELSTVLINQLPK